MRTLALAKGWRVPLLAFGAAVLCTCAKVGPDKNVCEAESYSCRGHTALKCLPDGTGYVVERDCAKNGQICTSVGCRLCEPDQQTCVGEKLLRCRSDGAGYNPKPDLVCDVKQGQVCNQASCVNACELAAKNRSYVGCEYWAVDLDNAVVEIGSAAAQQYAVVLSNPSPLPAAVKVSINEAAVGEPVKLKVIEEREVGPQALEVLLLPSREVDGSPPGEYNTGTGTALTSNAYKIQSSVPIIAYQFNPLSNVGVFSNDASLLVPTQALTVDAKAENGASYLVMGWPQTIASTGDPKTNFGNDLRSFLTIVGTRENTQVKIKLSTAIISDGATGRIPAAQAGDVLEMKLGPFDVLNLETGGFGKDADFTGTVIDADHPVAVFSGAEAADVPDFTDLTFRRCCADHLEEQLFPKTTLGRTFIALVSPSRSVALKAAGATIQEQPKEKEYFRILTAGEFSTVTTSLPAPRNRLSIGGGKYLQVETDQDFTIQGNDPLVVGQFNASQQVSGIPSSLPGGDPSFILLPPVEQFRKDYLFLTPDKYSFDFIMVAAPKDATVRLDGRTLAVGCDTTQGAKICCTLNPVGKVKRAGDLLETEYVAWKCQLSFPRIIEGKVPPENLAPGEQYDGVHRLTATHPVGLVVYGFDAFVSYGYPGGTDLALINLR
ncbi:MAG: hypothetical protein IT371_05285 [Deltaproteobacteria bacterium]|nr:hypothetical protein [Deltaproteobacteria bacterium]